MNTDATKTVPVGAQILSEVEIKKALLAKKFQAPAQTLFVKVHQVVVTPMRSDRTRLFYYIRGQMADGRWVHEEVDAVFTRRGKLVQTEHTIYTYAKKPTGW